MAGEGIVPGRALKSGFLIGAAIGSGSNALAAEHGGADFLLAINAGRLRNMGVPSIASMLPVYDARALTDSYAREELLALCKIPVLLGVNVWEREFDPAREARSIAEAGFAGAVNFPSSLHYSRPLQQILSQAGRGMEQEVAMLKAVQDVGLTSMFYCASRTQARLAADAGLDLVCLNIGWNAGGKLGHHSRSTLEEVATTARDIGRLIKRISPKTRFLLEGGPIAMPEDLARVLSVAPVDGYVGGSTIDRLPLESSVAGLIDGFRQASIRSTRLDESTVSLLSWARPFGFIGRSQKHLAMLRALHGLSKVKDPVLLLSETGHNPLPALKALAGVDSQGRGLEMVQIDVAEQDFPARARNVLFGHRDTLANHRPVLADPKVKLVVIQAPEKLTPALQRRLAKALREGLFSVAGARHTLPVEARVVLLCQLESQENRLQEDLLAAGLEEDLIMQMAGWTLRLPPLRERLDDFEEILEHSQEQQPEGAPGPQAGLPGFAPAVLQKLRSHAWPGNEAELHRVLGALLTRPTLAPVQPEEVEALFDQDNDSHPRADSRSEKVRIAEALWRHGFNRTKTAQALGMSRKTLYNKIQKFELS
ncbi:phosphoenolpyruvate hydrolase family protein [Rhodovibrionaceae bacterium A322]